MGSVGGFLREGRRSGRRDGPVTPYRIYRFVTLGVVLRVRTSGNETDEVVCDVHEDAGGGLEESELQFADAEGLRGRDEQAEALSSR